MMEQAVFMTISRPNNKGFTLIEVMVAMIIMVVGLLGLLKSIGIVMKQNTDNQQRDEVVRVAEEAMNGMRSQSLDSAFTPITTVQSKLRSGNARYTVIRTGTTMPSGSVKYQVTVRWKFDNHSTTHTIVSVRSK